jgi:hypothetical protein
MHTKTSISKEIDYEKLIRDLHSQRPKNITDLIYAIVALIGNENTHILPIAEAIQVIREFDEELDKISYIDGPELSHKSILEYNLKHEIKINPDWLK